jgi:hypothetical protein
LLPPTQPPAGDPLVFNFTLGDLVSQLLLNRLEELVGQFGFYRRAYPSTDGPHHGIKLTLEQTDPLEEVIYAT